jgi:hypothetical protein
MTTPTNNNDNVAITVNGDDYVAITVEEIPSVTLDSVVVENNKDVVLDVNSEEKPSQESTPDLDSLLRFKGFEVDSGLVSKTAGLHAFDSDSDSDSDRISLSTDDYDSSDLEGEDRIFVRQTTEALKDMTVAGQAAARSTGTRGEPQSTSPSAMPVASASTPAKTQGNAL